MTTQLEQQMPFRYHVGVRVSTEHSEPQRITVMLGLQPHRASRRGEVPQEMEHLGEKVRGVYERHHKWAASFEPLSPTEPLNACLKRVANHLQKLKNFPDGNSFFFPLHVSRIARRRPRRPTAFSMPGFFGQAAEYQNYKA